MKNTLLSTAASFAFATTAIAGNPAPVSPAMAVVVPTAATTGADWGGFYAGGLVSFDSGTLAYSNPPGSAPFVSYDYNPNTAYGGFAGYNMQRGKMVFGAEVAYNSGGSYVVTFATEGTSYVADLKGRVGFAAGNALLYGVVGYSFADWTTVTNTYPASGLSYGAGVDYLIGEHLFVGAEYLARDMSGNGTIVATIEGHSQIQSAALRLGWKF